MNPACSVSLGMYEWRRQFTTQILKHTWTRGDFRPLTTWTHELTGCESHFMRMLPFNLRKLASYHTVYTRGGTVHVFVPNRHGTGISVWCMRPYDEYRQFTPIQKGAPEAMQRCLITASRRTANANGDTEVGALMFGSLYFILLKYQLAVKLAMLELMCFVCVCVCVCVRAHFNFLVSFYQQIQL